MWMDQILIKNSDLIYNDCVPEKYWASKHHVTDTKVVITQFSHYVK